MKNPQREQPYILYSIANMSAISFIRLNRTGTNETNFVVCESCQLRLRASQSNLCKYLGFVLLF